MNYGQIRSMDISNGEGIGVSLFVQGCHFHCFNCFNQETWNIHDGKEFTEEIKESFFKLIDRPYIKRISILGGSPLIDENVSTVLELVTEIKEKFPDKKIWLYTGYLYENIMNVVMTDEANEENFCKMQRKEVVSMCDILIDGPYIDSLKDTTLKFRGSSNQRIIDVQESLKQNKVVLWES